MLGAVGKSFAAARGGGAVAFSPICAASPSANSTRTPRGTTAIDRCDIASKVLAVQVKKRRGTDQHEVKQGLTDNGPRVLTLGADSSSQAVCVIESSAGNRSAIRFTTAFTTRSVRVGSCSGAPAMICIAAIERDSR